MRFMNFVEKIKIDLVLIMGTALAVAPFNILPSLVKEGVPQVLMNLSNTKETGGLDLDFTEKGKNRLFLEGESDMLVR